MAEKEEKKEDLLKEQCGEDKELYDFLCHTLYVDPIAAISRSDIAALTEEADTSRENANYRDALRKYQSAVNKAIFEATQYPGERNGYIKIIRTLVPKTIEVIEKVKEKAENEGLAERARYFEKEIENYEFLSRRIEDVINTASRYYNERIKELEETERKAAIKAEQKEREEKKRKG